MIRGQYTNKSQLQGDKAEIYYRLTSQNKPEKQGTGDTLYPVLCEEVCIFVFC